MKLGDKENRALKPDAQAFDEVIITTVPRFKESELSGDEWRIHAQIEFKRKGVVVHTEGCRDVAAACGLLNWYFVNACDNGKGYFSGERDICDQEGCSAVGTNKMYKKFNYCRQGHKSDLLWPTFRLFCDRHKNRGDSSFDDSNANYKEAA